VPIANKEKRKETKTRWDGILGKNQGLLPTKNRVSISGEISNLPLKSLEKIPENL
jgi:hypothetical protein